VTSWHTCCSYGQSTRNDNFYFTDFNPEMMNLFPEQVSKDFVGCFILIFQYPALKTVGDIVGQLFRDLNALADNPDRLRNLTLFPYLKITV